MITLDDWRKNPARCAEFEMLLAHPMMQDALALLRENALPVLSREMMLPAGSVDPATVRDNYVARGGIVWAITFLQTLAKPAGQEPAPLPPEWLSEPPSSAEPPAS